MIRTPLQYHRPATVTEANQILLDHHGNVAVLGGGTFLLPRMTRHESEVDHVVDPVDLGLDEIRSQGDAIDIGARTTYADVVGSAMLNDRLPLLPRMARGITGGRQLMQQATLVGTVCFQFPTTDAPGALTALDTQVRLHGPDGERLVPIQQFLLDAYSVDIRPGELVTGLRVTARPRGGYCKVKHSSGSWPIVTASAVPADGGAVRVTLGAVEALPVSVTLHDPRDRAELKRLVNAAVTKPWTDVLAPGTYRASIAATVAGRAVDELEGVAS